MATAIIYYSEHHGNTRKLLDAIQAADPSVLLIDVTRPKAVDLTAFDRIGLASGIYYSGFARQVIAFAEAHLPQDRDVFYIYTHGAPGGSFLKGIRSVVEKRHCREIGEYRCQGYDTFGPFKLVGGIAKGHPTAEEIEGAVQFYQGL